MDPETFHRATGPTRWPSPPELYSFSSLRELSACLRRWQLTHAHYGDLHRLPETLTESSQNGTIVHELLHRVLAALSLAGLPDQGTEAFSSVISSLDLPGRLQKSIDQAHARTSGHPRAAGARLRLSPTLILRMVMEQFQLAYPTVRSTGRAWSPAKKGGHRAEHSPASRLASAGLLSEEYVRHPTLPIHGFIDLVHTSDEGTIIVDFKTGARHDDHRKQGELYALLWWRRTGLLPSKLVVQYLDGVARWQVEEARLVQLEETLAAEIAYLEESLRQHPAEPSLGLACRRCPGRPFCDEYWATPPEPDPNGFLDVALRVTSVSSNAATGQNSQGEEITLVWEEQLDPSARPRPGEQVRVLGATSEQRGVFRLRRSSELFHRS